MAKLSEAANLSHRYANHCLQTTIATRLSRAGVEARKIIKVTGHKNESSLKHYVDTPTTSEKCMMSNLIHSTEAAASIGPALNAAQSTQMSIPWHSSSDRNQIEVLDQGMQPMGQNTLQSSALFAGAMFLNATIVINNNFYNK